MTMREQTCAALAAAGLEAADVERVIRAALEEDLRYGPDITTVATVPAGAVAVAEVVARRPGVVAGVPVALAVLDLAGLTVMADEAGLRRPDAEGATAGESRPRGTGAEHATANGTRQDGIRAGTGPAGGAWRDGAGAETAPAGKAGQNEASAGTGPAGGAWRDGTGAEGSGAGRVEVLRGDGSRVGAGEAVLRVTATARGLLTAERTLLNLMTRLSGIATATRAWADAVEGTGAVVRDTRKTTPGLRLLEKYAVRCGGGANHRLGLGDAALIKDNHVAAAGGIGPAIGAVRAAVAQHGGLLDAEVECDTLGQVAEALAAGCDLILCDNMNLAQLRAAVTLARDWPGVQLEASGGLTLDSAREVALTGVDFLAVGALTHSSPALDFGLDLRSAELSVTTS